MDFIITLIYINKIIDYDSRFKNQVGRLEALRTLNGLNIHDAPGIQDLKQLELWNKWRNLIDDPVIADEICPNPRPELLKRLQDAKRKKEQDKRKFKAEVEGKGATKKKKTNKR